MLDTQRTFRIDNASHWQKREHANSTLTQYSPKAPTIEKSLHCFNDLLNEALWQTRYGAFAQVWVDRQTHDIFLVRDHFGCEPLYYYLDDKQFVFSSNLPDLLKQLAHQPEWNKLVVTELLTGAQYYRDETYHEKIFRVEPGCWVHIRRNRGFNKHRYWCLEAEADELALKNDQAYLDRFAELMQESIEFNGRDHFSGLAGELSGGLDSSSILATAHQQGFHYPLFMHIAPPNSNQVDDLNLAKMLLAHLGIKDAHFINADGFDPLATFEHCAQLFAGPSPYLFPMLSYNITSAVSQAGRTVLLSGAGGDECVSSHASQNGLIGSIIKQNGFQGAWQALQKEYSQKGSNLITIVKRAEKLLRYSSPTWFYLLSRSESCYQWIKKVFETQAPSPFAKTPSFYPSIRACEQDRLQGAKSQTLRGRIEYSAVMARSLGFEYRYPLLYPELVEFCFRLPLNQKYRNGERRYLIRRYLESLGVPKPIYQKQQKAGGILPATLAKCFHLMREGQLDKLFEAPPGCSEAQLHQALILAVPRYMSEHYQIFTPPRKAEPYRQTTFLWVKRLRRCNRIGITFLATTLALYQPGLY